MSEEETKFSPTKKIKGAEISPSDVIIPKIESEIKEGSGGHVLIEPKNVYELVTQKEVERRRPKKYKPKVKDYTELEKKVKELEKAIQTLSKEAKKEKKHLLVKEAEELKGIKYEDTGEVILWPRLGTVNNPMTFYNTKGKNLKRVRVASRAWWMTLDELRMSGAWDMNDIKNFLKESGEVIRDLTNFDLKLGKEEPKEEEKKEGEEEEGEGEGEEKKEQKKQKMEIQKLPSFQDQEMMELIERFAIFYPDRGVRKRIIDREYDRLMTDIRKSFRLDEQEQISTRLVNNDNPFKPKNYDQIPDPFRAKPSELGGPRNVTFILNTKDGQRFEFKNFLRHFTKYTTDKKGNLIPAVGTKDKIIEVRPDRREWVPSEYRDIIYQYYDLREYKQIDENLWRVFFFHLTFGPYSEGEGGSEKEFVNEFSIRIKTRIHGRESNEEGEYWIPAKDIYGRIWETSIAFMKVNLYSPNLKLVQGSVEPGEVDPDIPMYKWTGKFEMLYPKSEKSWLPALYRFIVNVPPYTGGMSEKDIKDYVIEYVYKDFKSKRLSSLAPLKFWRQALIMYFAPEEHNSVEQCEVHFLEHFYNYVLYNDRNHDFPDSMPHEWVNYLRALYHLDNKKGCHHVVRGREIITSVAEKSLSIPELPSPVDASTSSVESLRKYGHDMERILSQWKKQSL